MNVKRPLTAAITIGDQPTEADLAELKREGYTAVVNLRNDGEPDQPLSTALEGTKVRELGMDYLHHGVGSASLTVQGVKEVCDFIDKHSQESEKVLVHCRRGPAPSRSCCCSRPESTNGPTPKSSPRGKRWG